MKWNYAKKPESTSPQTTVFFCAHNPGGFSANTSENECAEYTCAWTHNEKDTSFAVSFSLFALIAHIALFTFLFLIAIPIFGVTLVHNPLLVLGEILVFHQMILSIIKSNELYRH